MGMLCFHYYFSLSHNSRISVCPRRSTPRPFNAAKKTDKEYQEFTRQHDAMKQQQQKQQKQKGRSGSSGTLTLQKLSREVGKARLALTDIYSQIILRDPTFAVSKDVTYSMWQLFYRYLNSFRLNKTSSKREAFAKALAESLTFFQYLISHLERVRKEFIQSIPLSDSVCSTSFNDNLLASQSSSQDNASLFNSPVSKILYKLYVSCGDIHRYQTGNVPPENGKSDWSKAEESYFKAIVILPGRSEAYGQLAVVAQTKVSTSKLASEQQQCTTEDQFFPFSGF